MKCILQFFTSILGMEYGWNTFIKQLFDEVDQNITICQWQADQLFSKAGG